MQPKTKSARAGVGLTVNESQQMAAGDMVGSALFLGGSPADVDAIAVEPVRSMRWEVRPPDRYLAAIPETRIAMQSHLARDLAGKLERALARKVS